MTKKVRFVQRKSYSFHSSVLISSYLFASLAILLHLPSTIYAQDLTIDTNTTWPAGIYSYDNILITNGATLTLQSNPSTGEGVTLNITNLTIDLGSSISANSQGYPSASGPGAGSDGNWRGGGAGYGGNGGTGDGAGGISYGSITQPNDLGSGGGNATSWYTEGGAGGGLIRIECPGSLAVNGSILANGNDGGYRHLTWGNSYGGGGSGGSIYIAAGELSGAGVITANGGTMVEAVLVVG